VEHILIPKRLRDKGESSSSAVSQYALLHGMALPIILYPISPLSSFSGLLVPEFAESSAEGDMKRLKRIAGSCMDMTLVYSIMLAVILFVFSEDLGYMIYNSYEAGKFVALLAPIVPLMYLDHVTDSMLKGIGEQVFSMWVNITDSALSVVLVWSLIPKMGINGYALVIIIMEAYNFVLSYFTLRSKIKFTINVPFAIIVPAFSSLVSASFVRKLFRISGSSSTPFWLFMELGFAVSVFVACNTLIMLVLGRKIKNKRVGRIV
jgi:stage V sporulation protein B